MWFVCRWYWKYKSRVVRCISHCKYGEKVSSWTSRSRHSRRLLFQLRPRSKYVQWKVLTSCWFSNFLFLYSGLYNCILATSEIWCWSGERGILRKLSVWCSNVYYYNGAQRYEQFLQVGQMYWALVQLCHPSTSVSSIFIVLYT